MSSDGHLSSGLPGDDVLLGTVIAERYQIDRLLGEGGMGTVYLARHLTLEKEVALKVLHGELSRKPELVERFLQEAKAASRIRNPHVIDITDFGVTPAGQVFFAMERLHGRDMHAVLADALETGGLSWERARSILLQIGSALSAAHEVGIIHRDLKPENVYLIDFGGRKEHVKLLDFGIAKVVGNDGSERKLTKTGMVFGTPEYMAPEQAKGESPDRRVDVYALGCLLYQCLAGRVPFQAESFMGVLTMHLTAEHEPIPEVELARLGAPLGLNKVLERALAKDREQRYPTIEAMTKELRNPPALDRRSRLTQPFVQDMPRDPGWTGALRNLEDFETEDQDHPPRRRRWPLLVLGGVGAAVIAATAMVMVSSGEERGSARDVGSIPAAMPAPFVDASVVQPSQQKVDSAERSPPAGNRDSSAPAPGQREQDAAAGGRRPASPGTRPLSPSPRVEASSSEPRAPAAESAGALVTELDAGASKANGEEASDSAASSAPADGGIAAPSGARADARVEPNAAPADAGAPEPLDEPVLQRPEGL